MITVPYVPLFVTRLLRGRPGIWKNRHRLSLCGLVCMPALYPGQNTWAARARWTPAQVTVWRFRRLLKASAWPVHLLVAWGGQDACNPLPPSSAGDLSLGGDGRDKPQRGTTNPRAQQGRNSEPHPWFFGRRFALLMAHWDVYRMPVACRLSRPKRPPESQPDKALGRERVGDCVPPAWAKRMSVEGEAAYGAQANRPLVLQREANEPARRWGFVCAMARPGKTVEGQALKDWGTPVPRPYAQRPRGPRRPGATGGTICWIFSTHLCLRHIGDVTGVLSQSGRNVGPKNTKSLVPTRDEWTRGQVVGAYQRRGPVEQINRELQTDLGLGAHQGSGEERRIETSFGMAVLAYVWRIRAGHQEMLPGTSWSVSQLQQAFRLRVMTNQVAHKVKSPLAKVRKAA